jgi:hypothetical protein
MSHYQKKYAYTKISGDQSFFYTINIKNLVSSTTKENHFDYPSNTPYAYAC